jgi:hypothetical protein
MSIDHLANPQAFFLGKMQDPFSLFPGIDNRCLAGPATSDDKAIDLQRPDAHLMYNKSITHH